MDRSHHAEVPIRALKIRSKDSSPARKPHSRPVSVVEQEPVRLNKLDKVSRSLVSLSKFNTYLRRRARTETCSWQTGTETSTTRKDNSLRNKATDAASSTNSTRTSKRRLLKTLLSDLE